MNNRYIREIAEALADKHAALMVGAGFSKNAEKITVTDKSFLDWNELSDIFYEKVYGESEKPGKEYSSSLRLAQEVEVICGRPKLEKIIKDAVPDLEYAPSEIYVKLMELPWTDIFTTNYDTLLERAAEKVIKRRYNVVVSQEDIVNSNDASRILKLHGSFPSHRPFIITEEDYRTYPVKFAAFVNTVQQALLENIFCMIGFSGDDPNFINWIGWIHDNLGKSSSQKMYMVSVSHMSEAKRKLLFERNIVIVDLEELWPKNNVGDRIKLFLDELGGIIKEKERKDNWFEIEIIKELYSLEFKKKIELMHKLNDSYPGWIFLPWKMKEKVKHVLNQLDDISGFTENSFQEQLDYMYEYVKLWDISGRPILSQIADLFWDCLSKNNSDEQIVDSDNKYNYKIQVVYLHLLRTYRELADWEKYDTCYKRINVVYLDYEGRQFLKATECWNNLFRFQAENLLNILEKWELAQGDMYWPLIKASMYALIGEIHIAEDILMNDLILVRRQLVKVSKNEYLSSIEESIVSLLNFIRQGDYTEKLEECINDGEVSWWNENDSYCLHLNEKNKKRKIFETNDNYDLSYTYTMNICNDNSDVFYGIEYLRFLEQTGHFFRLQNVTNTKGLSSIIKIIAPYYPHWCLIHILIAQEKKYIDYLFGRVNLARLSRENVDNITKEYINILKVLIEKVEPQNSFKAKSIYEQAAVVLPEIISRFSYKCSIEVLDEILDITLELCISNVRKNFRRLDKLLKGVVSAYTRKEQKERINKILLFPIEIDKINGYYDPIIYVRKAEYKYKLDKKLYDNVIFQVRQLLDNNEGEGKDAALQRLIVLGQIIELTKKDKEFLCKELEKENSLENNFLLYSIDGKKFRNSVSVIFQQTLESMKVDSDEKCLRSYLGEYDMLIDSIVDLNVVDVNIVETFTIMEKLVKTNIGWAKNHYEAKRRIAKSFSIAVWIMILHRNSGLNLTQQEREHIERYFSALSLLYKDAIVIKMIISYFINDIDMDDKEIKTKLFLSDNDGIELLINFISILGKCKLRIKERVFKYIDIIFEFVTYRLFNDNIRNLEPDLRLCYSLLSSKTLNENELLIVDIVLQKLADETSINESDVEEEALAKLKCRIQLCLIAKKLFINKYKCDGIYKWKDISQSENEFIEIRQIKFDE